MIFGSYLLGDTLETQPAHGLRGVRATVSSEARLAKLTVRMDGLGSGAGDQDCRPVVYRTSDRALVAAGEVVTVLNDQPERWVDLLFEAVAGAALPPDTYDFGVHFGTTANVIRLRRFTGTATGWSATGDPFTDSAADPGVAPAGATGISLFATANPPVVIAPNLEDAEYARLGFHTAQSILGATPPVSRSARLAVAEWHGTRLDPERGSNAVVRSGGPLADLVGERLRVSDDITGRAVAVYCHNEAEDLDADISLPRRAFLAVGHLASEELDVVVETLS